MAGAVAPAATVNLYLSAGSPYQDPLALAALRAIEDNQADVLSISWGAGEQELGTSGDQVWNALWEQAAAQGQTVLVATGDYGQIPDTNYLYEASLAGPAVNGLASTPWNIAVGGTDFYYSDYATGAPSASTFWNAANDPVTKGSLKTPITEQVWNDAYGLDAFRSGTYAAGGGASNCTNVNAITGGCVSGYAKPAWQTGPGVPADGVRDIPDVSLFASNGANYSAYVTCDSEGDCTPDASGNFNFDLVGGTSGSTPAMAAITALVVQKYGRQGQADTVLYPLAQQKPTAFHDVTLGGNWDVCVQGDADCALSAGSEEGESTVYSAAAGFDLASGWGSVDAANLVNNWNAIAFSSTATSLQVSPSAVTHGQNVTLNASVAPTSGSGTPTGTVAILANSPLPSNGSQTAIALSGGEGSASVNDLPGGTYELTAQYGGDGVFASSTSQPQTLTVSPEASTLVLKAVSANANPISSLSYGYPAYLTAQPVGAKLLAGQSDGSATGSIAFTLDGATTSIPLNVSGIASWTTPALSVGSHTASASYSGDASFQASSAAALNFTVYKGYPVQLINVLAPLASPSNEWVISPSGSISISAEVGPSVGILSGSVAPPGVDRSHGYRDHLPEHNEPDFPALHQSALRANRSFGLRDRHLRPVLPSYGDLLESGAGPILSAVRLQRRRQLGNCGRESAEYGRGADERHFKHCFDHHSQHFAQQHFGSATSTTDCHGDRQQWHRANGMGLFLRLRRLAYRALLESLCHGRYKHRLVQRGPHLVLEQRRQPNRRSLLRG